MQATRDLKVKFTGQVDLAAAKSQFQQQLREMKAAAARIAVPVVKPSVSLTGGTGQANTIRQQREQAKAAREQQREAQRLFKTQAALTKQRIAEQLRQQAKAARELQQGLRGLAIASGAIATGFATFGGQGLREFSAFDDALTSFSAKSGIARDQLGGLEKQAVRLAAITSQTPASVAKLSAGLLSLGASAEAVEGNLGAITKLSDVIAEDPLLTGQVIQTGLNIFGNFGETSDGLADKINKLINTTAAGSQQGVSEFFNLFSDAAPVAADAGVEFDQLAASFATLRDNGLPASNASTALKNALISVAAPTAGARKELESLGISFAKLTDDTGRLQFDRLIESLAESLADVSSNDVRIQKLAAIFGRRAAPAVSALVANVERLNENLAQVENASGSVDKSLEVVNQSLGRQFELLKGGLSGVATEFGAVIATGVEPLLSVAIKLVSGFLELPDPIKQTVLAITGFTGALTAAIAVVAAFQTLQIAAKAAAIAHTAAVIAQTLATKGAAVTQALFNTQVTLAQAKTIAYQAALAISTVAQGGFAAATGVSATALGSFASAAAAALAPIAALGAAIALVEVQRFAGTLQDANELIERNRIETDITLKSGARAQKELRKAAEARNAALREGKQLTDEQVAAEEKAIAQAGRTLTLLEQQLQELRAIPAAQAGIGGLGTEAAANINRARQQQIADVEAQIEAIKKRREVLTGATADEKQQQNEIVEKEQETADKRERIVETAAERRSRIEKEQADARKAALQTIADVETESQIEIQRSINENRISAEDAELLRAKAAQARADKEVALAENTKEATLQALQAQEQVQKALEQVALARIEKETQAEARSQREIELGLQRRIDLQQSAEQAIARRQRLLEAEFNVLKSQSSLQQTAFDIAADLSDNETEQKRLQQQAATARVTALKQEQALQLELFEISEQQRKSELERLQIQNRIKQSELELQRIQTEGELRKAQLSNDAGAAQNLALQLRELAQQRENLQALATGIEDDIQQNQVTRSRRRQAKQNELTGELLQARAAEAKALDDPKLRRQVEQDALAFTRQAAGVPQRRAIPIAEQTAGIQIPGINASAIAQQLQAQQQAQAENIRQMAQVYTTQQKAQAETLRQTLQVAQQEQAQAIRERLQLQQSAIAQQIQAGTAIVNVPAQPTNQIPPQLVPSLPPVQAIDRPAGQQFGINKDVLVAAFKEALQGTGTQQVINQNFETTNSFAVGTKGTGVEDVADQVDKRIGDFAGEVIKVLKG